MRTNSILAALFGLALVAMLLAGGYFTIMFLAGLFVGVDQAVVAVAVTLALAVLAGAALISGSVRWLHRKDAAKLHADRASIYERVLHMRAAAPGHASARPIVSLEDEAALDRLMLLRAGPAVLEAYQALRVLERAGSPHDLRIPAQVAQLVLAMRKDLGMRNLTLQEEDVLDLLLDVQSAAGKHRNTGDGVPSLLSPR